MVANEIEPRFFYQKGFLYVIMKSLMSWLRTQSTNNFKIWFSHK